MFAWVIKVDSIPVSLLMCLLSVVADEVNYATESTCWHQQCSGTIAIRCWRQLQSSRRKEMFRVELIVIVNPGIRVIHKQRRMSANNGSRIL